MSSSNNFHHLIFYSDSLYTSTAQHLGGKLWRHRSAIKKNKYNVKLINKKNRGKEEKWNELYFFHFKFPCLFSHSSTHSFLFVWHSCGSIDMVIFTPLHLSINCNIQNVFHISILFHIFPNYLPCHLVSSAASIDGSGCNISLKGTRTYLCLIYFSWWFKFFVRIFFLRFKSLAVFLHSCIC